MKKVHCNSTADLKFCRFRSFKSKQVNQKLDNIILRPFILGRWSYFLVLERAVFIEIVAYSKSNRTKMFYQDSSDACLVWDPSPWNSSSQLQLFSTDLIFPYNFGQLFQLVFNVIFLWLINIYLTLTYFELGWAKLVTLYKYETLLH